MKTKITSPQSVTTAVLAAFALALSAPAHIHAKTGATDPIPGTSKGTVNSGGGGGTTSTGGGASSGGVNSNKPTGGVVSTPTPVVPTPTTPSQQLVIATLNFTAAASVNGVIPVCTGSYRIDPYYPTLSLMTVDVQTSSMNVPDGSPLYVTVNLSSSTAYPITSNVITITAGAGTCSLSQYVTPGVTVSSVVVTDASGAVVSAGN